MCGHKGTQTGGDGTVDWRVNRWEREGGKWMGMAQTSWGTAQMSGRVGEGMSERTNRW